MFSAATKSVIYALFPYSILTISRESDIAKLLRTQLSNMISGIHDIPLYFICILTPNRQMLLFQVEAGADGVNAQDFRKFAEAYKTFLICVKGDGLPLFEAVLFLVDHIYRLPYQLPKGFPFLPRVAFKNGALIVGQHYICALHGSLHMCILMCNDSTLPQWNQGPDLQKLILLPYEGRCLDSTGVACYHYT